VGGRSSSPRYTGEDDCDGRRASGGECDNALACEVASMSLFRSRAGTPHTCGAWASALALLRIELPSCAPPSELFGAEQTAQVWNNTMAAIYRPTEAIQLLRSVTKGPVNIHRKRAARVAFSTSRPSQSSQTSKGPPQPTRRAVTIANDTGAVRWTDLSPGEKASRTVQQSMNLSVVLVGIVMTVGLLHACFLPTPTDVKTVWRGLLSLCRRLQPRLQDCTL
jgi:hypothetical protein